MGACCNCKGGKNDNREEEIYTKSTRAQILSEHKNAVVPQMEFEVEKNNLNKKLSEIIRKFSNTISMANLNMRKLTMEQLYNVCRYYLDDYTNSEYILMDLRTKDRKNENFLKKFKLINYSIDEMRLLKEISLASFKRYLDLKNIIMILSEEELKLAEEIIEFVIQKKIKTKICLFDNNLNFNEMIFNNKHLYEIIDLTNFKDFPFIMLSLKFFPHLKSKNFILFDYIKPRSTSGEIGSVPRSTRETMRETLIEKKGFTKNFLCNVENYETNIVKFFLDFNVSILYQIQNEELINNEEIVSNSNFNDYLPSYVKYPEEINIKLQTCKLLYSSIRSMDDLIKKKYLILYVFDIIKFDVLCNKSVFIQIDESLDINVLIHFIFLFVWKMTDICPKRLNNYIIDNFIFIKDIKDYCTNNFNRIEDFLRDVYDYKDEDLYELKTQNTDTDDVRLVTEKFIYYLKRLKGEVEQKVYLNIISTFEKIITNILENQENEKYFKIKTESQHFKNFISINYNSLKLLQLFGFNKNNINGIDFFCLSIDTNISNLRALFLDFSNAVKTISDLTI